MKLTPPKFLTFSIALVLGALGIIGSYTSIPFVSGNAFWFVAVGFILLVLGVLFRGL